jgi:hypothetical protein
MLCLNCDYNTGCCLCCYCAIAVSMHASYSNQTAPTHRHAAVLPQYNLSTTAAQRLHNGCATAAQWTNAYCVTISILLRVLDGACVVVVAL